MAAARETAETEDGDAESKHKQAGKHSKRLPNRHVIHVKLSQDLSLGGGMQWVTTAKRAEAESRFDWMSADP